MYDIRRGAIKNRGRANQQYDYSGLLYGRITPTDVDGLLEFGDVVYIAIELKSRHNSMPTGQRIALEHLTDALSEAGRCAICLLAEHDTPYDEDVDVAAAIVVQYRYNGAWRTPLEPVTIHQAIDAFLQQHAPRYLNH